VGGLWRPFPDVNAGSASLAGVASDPWLTAPGTFLCVVGQRADCRHHTGGESFQVSDRAPSSSCRTTSSRDRHIPLRHHPDDQRFIMMRTVDSAGLP